MTKAPQANHCGNRKFRIVAQFIGPDSKFFAVESGAAGELLVEARVAALGLGAEDFGYRPGSWLSAGWSWRGVEYISTLFACSFPTRRCRGSGATGIARKVCRPASAMEDRPRPVSRTQPPPTDRSIPLDRLRRAAPGWRPAATALTGPGSGSCFGGATRTQPLRRAGGEIKRGQRRICRRGPSIVRDHGAHLGVFAAVLAKLLPG